MASDREEILGYRVTTQDVQAIGAAIVSWIKAGDRCRWLACFNPHSYATALNDAPFSIALRDADWLVPDGGGIVLASRVLKGQIQKRVTGSDVFQGVHECLNAAGGHSVFFLGSTEETLTALRQKLGRECPRIRVAGTYSPPFKPEFTDQEMDAMVNAINSVQPDVLWVGMTQPKQEKWIYQNRNRLKVKFAGAVGAVFDFYTGRVKRSSPLFQKLGLEWLPRLIRNPLRLWRRMFVSAPVFLWHLFLSRFSKKG